MQALIGNRLISSLKPKAKPYEVRDSRLKGFILRVQSSGVMSYICEYGRGKRITIGRASVLTPAQARDEAKRILADATKGIDPRAANSPSPAASLATYLDEQYGPWLKAHTKTGTRDIERIKARFGEFLNRKLDDIQPWDIEKWRSARLNAGTKPVTVNRDLAPLKTALARAVGWGLISESPLRVVKPSKVDTLGKLRFLSADEEQRLRTTLVQREQQMRERRSRFNAWRAERGQDTLPEYREDTFTDHLQPMVLLSINTGLRRGELFSLAWADIDLDRALLTVAGTVAKSGKTRHVPLNSEALRIIRTWQKQHESESPAGLVFPGKEGKPLTDVKKAWIHLLADAQIEGFRWHDLRHHFASKLVMAGVDLNTVRELLGHSDIKMTLRYAHLAPEHKAAAIERLVAR